MLKNVVGQNRAKQMFTLLGQGFERRGKLPSVGIFGPSGLGKTHLINEWANEIGAKLVYINGTAVKNALAFRTYFEDAKKDQQGYFLVFIDEAHMLPKKVQENMLSVLEEPAVLCTVAPREMGNVQCVDGMRWIEKGDVIREHLPTNMSFVFATTDPAKLKETVLNRLRKIQLEPYTLQHKIEIAMAHLTTEGVSSDAIIHKALAHRCRNIRHLKGDLCETFVDINDLYGGDSKSKLELLDQMLGIDEDGATDLDRDYLEYLAHHKIAGVDTLAGRLKTDKLDLITRIEPFLMDRGWIMITSKGRVLTEDGRHKIFGEPND
jgi:Holliday junction DNA helicase RuvB